MNELLRLLLVEDNPGDAELIKEMLPRDGPGSFEIELASRLATAVELARVEHFDLVLLDLGLPDSAGLDTVRAVRRQAPDLPIVVLTGNDDERTGLAAIQEGAQDYVVKGQIPGALLSKVLRYALERHHHALRLRESEDRYRQSIELTGQIGWATAADGQLNDAPAWVKYTGQSPEEVKGWGWLSAVHQDDRERTEQVWKQSVDSRSGYETEYRLRRRDGVFRHVVARGVPLLNDQGDIQEWVGACIDITERKQAEEERLVLERQLQQSQKLESLGVLAGGIAHDFNNILTGVLGNAELALAELSPSAPGRENLLEITQASHRAAALCRQMLAYSGRGQFAREPIDLNALVEDMLGLLKSAISKKALLNLNLEKDLPLLEGDSSQLGQVIMNLVINASEAIGDKDGVITISTGVRECSREYFRESYAHLDLPSGPYLTLEVSDTGCGMDQETKERLFEPFFTTKFTGRGLGLAAVLGIVRGHKGALKVYSEAGKGTTFKIRFPAGEAGEGALARERAAEVSDWHGAGTVLLVDDEETIRTLGARMLSRLGFVVLTAGDGREALALYAQHRGEIVLVLLDLTMPFMDGEETFHELRALDPEVRVVMSSGYTEQDITSRFRDEGLVGFLQKPYTIAHLTERLRAALEGTAPAAGESGS
jgi:PAS domain S-box-containing protein